MRKVLGLWFLFVCATIFVPSASYSYSLAGDWSNVINPNGSWSYNAGSIPLAYNVASWPVGEFGAEQVAWANSNTSGSFLPGWFKSAITPNQTIYDWLAGDVVVHSLDVSNSDSNGIANVTWTNPVSGIYDISGGLWRGRTIGAYNPWNLYIDQNLLDTGYLFNDDGFSRDNPDSFSFQEIYIAAGSVLKLEVGDWNPGAHGDFVGVNFNINPVAAPVPEPATMLLFSLGGAGMALRRLRRRA